MHEECRITCDHRPSLWYLTGSLDYGLSRNAIRQWFVHDFVPMAAASRIEASASLSGEFRTLHSTTCCHTAECSPSIALAQCALGCKPQMCGRLLQKGATKTKRAYRTTHAHHRGEIRPESRPKAQPGMAGAIAGRLGRVCLAGLFGPISPAACRGMRRPGGCLRGPRPNRGFELWVPER